MKKNSAYLKSKLPNVGNSIFTVMSKMASDFSAINLSQGFPDFEPPIELKELVNFYIKQGRNQYAPMQGVGILREKISEKINNLYGADYDPENEITVTAGATQALYTAITTLITPGDEAIIFEPAYDLYSPVVLANGGIPVYVKLNEPGFEIDWNRVRDAVSEKTKLIIINSPHNPTGSVLNSSDIKNLEDIVINRNIFVVSDEVYEHIVYDNLKHESISKSKVLADRSFVISSFGKTYHTTGWKLGYCAAPARMMSEFRKIHQFVVFAVNTPVQYAFAEFLKNTGHYLSLNKFYETKRDLLISLLRDSRFKIRPAKGTYFQLLDYSEISGSGDINFAEYLTKEIGVAVIPLSPFYSGENMRKLVRICFAKNDDVLKAAAAKLCSI